MAAKASEKKYWRLTLQGKSQIWRPVFGGHALYVVNKSAELKFSLKFEQETGRKIPQIWRHTTPRCDVIS